MIYDQEIQFLVRVSLHLWTVIFYAPTLSLVGKEEFAVTTNVDINFVKKISQEDLLCHTRMLKFGKQLCVGDAIVYSEHDLIAQTSLTY